MERLLRKKEIAAMLGTTPNIAAAILREHGVWPIDLGRGRARGLHWLESAVVAVLQKLHDNAQPKVRSPERRQLKSHGELNLSKMSVSSLAALLTRDTPVQ